MKVLLDRFLPKIYPDLPFICIAHEGKNDLEKSLPRKIRGWREPGALFVVLRDADNCDCRDIKRQLTEICREAGRHDAVVRIVCQELESWYFGDPDALRVHYGNDVYKAIANKPKYRNPDALRKPSELLKRIIPSYQKVTGARDIATHLNCDRNKSPSFSTFMKAVDGLAGELKAKNIADIQVL